VRSSRLETRSRTAKARCCDRVQRSWVLGGGDVECDCKAWFQDQFQDQVPSVEEVET
jgi:hypothetical protein